MNEENGTRGGAAYHAANKDTILKQFAAMESDSGGGRPFGILASVEAKAEKHFAPVMAALQPIGAGVFTRRDHVGAADLALLEKDGVPLFQPQVDTSSYFHYHHTPADTLDKVDPENLRRHVAVMSTLSWYLANMEQPLGRAPVVEK
jgi:Zn-dependent M28 family amino/carboxypeptidase